MTRAARQAPGRRQPRVQRQVTPAPASRLSVLERFSGEIGTERLRRGVFTSVSEPVTAIGEYIAHHDSISKPLMWTKGARDIPQKVNRANSRLSSKRNDALHRRPLGLDDAGSAIITAGLSRAAEQGEHEQFPPDQPRGFPPAAVCAGMLAAAALGRPA